MPAGRPRRYGERIERLLRIEPELLQRARRYAQEQRLGQNAAICELIARGLDSSGEGQRAA